MGSFTPLRELEQGRSAAHPAASPAGPRVLLVVGGGIAAYKSCELVRLMRKGGAAVSCVVTDGGQQFVTPMALAALSENKVYTSLFDLKDESEMGHIQLSRQADLVVVCPATADLLAKMAAGIADDLATTLILATDKPVIAVPAMNVRMWEHHATKRNVAWLAEAGVRVLDPDEGAMACGEFGPGRLPEPAAIWAAIAEQLGLEHEPFVPAPQDDTVASFREDDAEPLDLDVVAPSDDETDWAAEALEPEDEPETPTRGGLSGLLSAIIPRAMPRRAQDDAEAQFAQAPDLDQSAQDDDGPDADGVDENGPGPNEPDIVFSPDTAGPLLAKKGGASSAPPTDPDALNHTVRTGAGGARPQPVALSDMPGFDSESAAETLPAAMGPEIASDPLAGQLEFDSDPDHRPLYGQHVLVTAGPTWEPIDPVRYIANRSSGRQGFAIAGMAAAAGARVTLIAGPVSLASPLGVDRIDVESAEEMAAAVKKHLPCDIAFMVAAVADWRPKDVAAEKLKKRGSAPPALMLTENQDILTSVAASRDRPKLLIGFAAETENVLDNAKTKRKRKGADWIIANDVSTDVMGGLRNTIHLVSSEGIESFDEMPKEDVARELIARAAEAMQPKAHSTDDD